MVKIRNLSRLFRRSTSGRFIPVIDGLRFFAIMPVLLLHASTAFLEYSPLYDHQAVGETEWLRVASLTGGAGVLIFFAISGFILTLPFAKHHLEGTKAVSLRSYTKRRLIRLEPPYLLTLVGFFFIHLLLQTDSFSELLPHFLASFFYLHNIIYGEWSVINPVAWSLEIEIQFYLLMPLIGQAFLLKKVPRRMLLFTFLGLAPLVHMLPLEQWHLSKSLLSHYQYFLAGILAADFYLEKDLRLTRSLNTLLIALSLPLIFVAEHHGGDYRWFLLPLVILVFVLASLNGSHFKSFMEHPLITTIGGACYITYLIHYPLLHLLARMDVYTGGGNNFTADIGVFLLIAVPIVLTVSLVAFVLVEKPFMLMSQGKLRGRLQTLRARFSGTPLSQQNPTD